MTGKRHRVGKGRIRSQINGGGLTKGRDNFFPPGVVKFSEARDHLGIGGGDVLLLAGIGVDVVQLLAIDEAPLVGHHRALAPLDWIAHSLAVGHQNAVRPVLRLALDQRPDVHAIKLHALRRRYLTVIDKGRHHVDIRGDGVHIAPAGEAAFGPVDKERYAMAAVVLAAFLAAHAVVVHARAGGGAVVRGENENSVVGQPLFFEEPPHGTDIVVDVGDHAVEVGEVHILVLIRFAGSLRRMHGAVRRVGAEVHEERFFAVFHLGDEALGIIKKDIGAKALGGHGFAVVKIGAIKVGVVPKIRRLAHAAAAVPQHLLKSAILRTIRIVVAQVPFTEHAGMITAIAKNFADGHLIMAQHGTTHDRMPYAGAISPAAGDQCRPRRRTGRSHVIIREPHTVRMQLIQMRCLQDWISMT